ncbi:hypothetical protein PSLUR01_00276 [Escherichia phage vB_Eco_slurp01]|uniref:Uncharacterized protein n=1 Tax=Escherichia phage vB_Eco_slurp01 TaxID=1874688 RepID=A0A1C3S6Z1_9CAUD|nr:hypothetical protein [Escherichia coli]SCA80253.1 hypothetical protein PSLUR01_00276 [Escherichia phage vB_Eco_slurp01]
MSLQSALEKAKELHGYFEDIKAGKFKEVYKAENGNYYKDEMYNNSVGVRVILGLNSNSPISFSEYNRDAEFISYVENGSIRFINRQKPLILNYEVLDGQWDSEEYYFQNSTVYDDEVLEALVIMWYFKSISFPRFYLDFEDLRKDPEGIE